jgi:hypothetical protein
VKRIAVVSWNFTQLDAFISFPQKERNIERRNGVPNCRKCKALVNSETNSRRLSKLLTNNWLTCRCIGNVSTRSLHPGSGNWG